MLFPIPERNRKGAATAHHLNSIINTLPKAPAHELRYISDQLKDPDYLWKVLALTYASRKLPKSRQLVRLITLFWAAEVRPATRGAWLLLSDDTIAYLNQVAFLLTVHRGLLKQELPIGGDRRKLFDHRGLAIDSYIKAHHAELAASELYEECRRHIDWVDVTVYCAKEEDDFDSMHKLAEYLDEFCLLPEDIGITAEQLAAWRHQQLVEQAQTKFSLCRTSEFEGHTYDPSILNIYANIYGVLLALTQGVSLEEAGITEDELRTAKLRLEQWLPDAIAEPLVHGVNAGGVISFNQQVMPMFDQVLPAHRGLHLVR